MYNPPRIALSFLRSAVERGAVAANYVEATGFLRNGGCVLGIQAKDILGNRFFEIRGRCVLNAAGPWAHHLLESRPELAFASSTSIFKGSCLRGQSADSTSYAIAFSTDSKDSDTLVDRGGRHLFAVPWRDYMLIGVWHKVYTDRPDKIVVETKEIESFVKEVNQAYPGIGIHIDEINIVNTGLMLFGEEGRQSVESMSFGKNHAYRP